MKINNENEEYILHFLFHTLHSTYQIINDPSNGKRCQHIKLWGDKRSHKISYMIIHQEIHI